MAELSHLQSLVHNPGYQGQPNDLIASVFNRRGVWELDHNGEQVFRDLQPAPVTHRHILIGSLWIYVERHSYYKLKNYPHSGTIRPFRQSGVTYSGVRENGADLTACLESLANKIGALYKSHSVVFMDGGRIGHQIFHQPNCLPCIGWNQCLLVLEQAVYGPSYLNLCLALPPSPMDGLLRPSFEFVRSFDIPIVGLFHADQADVASTAPQLCGMVRKTLATVENPAGLKAMLDQTAARFGARNEASAVCNNGVPHWICHQVGDWPKRRQDPVPAGLRAFEWK